MRRLILILLATVPLAACHQIPTQADCTPEADSRAPRPESCDGPTLPRFARG
ncbi:hypothetical protein [Parapedomonas caeni]